MRTSLAIGVLVLALVAREASGACLGVIKVAASPVGFGVYNPLSASPAAGTGQVTVTCNLLLGLGLLPAFTITLGQGIAGSYAPRRLANGASRLSYNLYQDAGYSTVWGNGLGGTGLGSYNGLLSLGTLNFTVHGQVPAGQDAAPGGYSDTIIVTVEF